MVNVTVKNSPGAEKVLSLNKLGKSEQILVKDEKGNLNYRPKKIQRGRMLLGQECECELVTIRLVSVTSDDTFLLPKRTFYVEGKGKNPDSGGVGVMTDLDGHLKIRAGGIGMVELQNFLSECASRGLLGTEDTEQRKAHLQLRQSSKSKLAKAEFDKEVDYVLHLAIFQGKEDECVAGRMKEIKA